jgi:hypothetical protein
LLTFLGETRKVSRPPGRDPANSLTKENNPKNKKRTSPVPQGTKQG